MLEYLEKADLLFWPLVISALVLMLLAFRGDPARGRRRCPRCWYDLTTLPGASTCPECGFTAQTERQLRRRRRSPRLAVVALLLFVSAYAALATPRVRARGWIGAAPTTALVVMPPRLSKTNWPWMFDHIWGEIRERDLWGWQQELLLRACLRGHPARPPGSPDWKQYEGGLFYWALVEGGLTPSQERRIWAVVAPTIFGKRDAWPAGVPVRIGLATLCQEASWFYGVHERELVAEFGGSDIAISMVLANWEKRNTTSWEPTDELRLTRWSDPWHDDTTEVGVLAPGATLLMDLRLYEGGRLIWQHAVPLTRAAARWDDVITPARIEFDSETRPVDLVDLPVVHPEKISFAPRMSSIASVLDGDCFGVIIEVCRDGDPVASGRYWVTPDPSARYCFDSQITVRLTGDLSSLFAAPDDDPSWTVRFRGDAETALRDFGATRCWSGEFTLSRGEFAIQR